MALSFDQLISRKGPMPAAKRCLFVCLCVSSVFCGCGRSPKMGRVEGTVRLDGQPIGNVFVIFQPRDRRLPQSNGLTDDAGHFELRCNNSQMGAVVGEHRVVLIDAARFPSAPSEDETLPEGVNAPPSRVPLGYTRPDKTPLQQSVQAGSQTVAIEVQSGRRS